MKKHLIAAAVAGALAVPAMAQVTIGGYLEASYTMTNNDSAATADTDKVDGGLFGSNRLVISGSEDLGGGLKAGFRLESSLNPSNGQAGLNTSVLFNRGSEVNLSGGFGMVRIGKFDHQGGENTDLNVVGNFALNSGVASGDNSNAANVELGSDRDGTIAYRTPTILGGYAEVAFTGEDQVTGQGAVTSAFFEGGMGALKFRVGYGKQEKGTGQTDDATRTGVGVSYDLGMAAVSVSYAKMDDLTGKENTESIVSVKVPLSGGFDVRGAYRNYENGTATSNDLKEYTVAGVYALSKRTNAFAAYRNYDYGTGSTADKTVTYLGVNHSF